LTAITQNKEGLEGKIGAMMHFSMRSGMAVIGQNRLEVTNPEEIGLVLLNGGISPNTSKKILDAFGEERCVFLKESLSIDSLTGKAGIKVIGFRKSELQKQILKLVKQYEEI
jgi:hypothetical protein